MFKCFISYRRKRPFAARHVAHRLTEHKFDVFFDIKGIEAGDRFPDIIEANLRQSNVVFVTIDDEWLVEKDGERRLNTPQDWVRQEIELALELKIPIIPLLVEGATMPRQEDLPDSLRDLAQFQGARLRNENFETDLDKIVLDVERLANLQLRAQEILDSVREHWEKGNWLQIHKRLIEASAAWGRDQGGRLMPPNISRRLAVSQQLMRVTECIAQRRLDAALTILSRVPLEDAPRNVECSIKILKIGNEAVAALENAQVDALKDAADAYSAAKRESNNLALEFVPGLEEVGKVISEAQAEISYRQALDAYQAGDFPRAQELLVQLGAHRGSSELLQACNQWVGFFNYVREREWDKAKSILATLGRVQDAPSVQFWRRWCNVMRRCISALDELGRGHVLVDPDVPWEGGECPYSVLGLPAIARVQTVQKISFDLQGKPGGMLARERNAWDSLRLPERRLMVDFGTYSVADCERVRRLTNELLTVTPNTLPTSNMGGVENIGQEDTASTDGKGSRSPVRQIAERLEDDAALFLRQMKMHDAALKDLAERCEKNPDKPRLLHHLGLLAASWINSGGDEDADFGTAWDKIVYSFGAVFADDRFWHDWWVDRQEVYQVTKAQVSEARQHLQRYWLDELKSTGEPGRNYNLILQTEISTARAVAEGGGIPLANGPRRAIVGPLGAKALSLQSALTDWVGTFAAECLDHDGWQRRVCLYFSELAEVVTLAEVGQHRGVLEAIAVLKKPARGDFAARNPGFARFSARESRLRRIASRFEEQAHHKLAIELITESPPRTRDAIEHWQTAAGIAQKLGERTNLLADVHAAVVARANQLKLDEAVDRLERLSNAINFLDAVRDGDLDGEPIVDAVVEATLDRAFFMANEHSDHEAARNDARRAWSIAQTPRALVALYASTISLAGDKHYAGRSDLAQVLLKEASKLYNDEAERLASTRSMEDWKKNADDLQRLIDNPPRGEEAEEAVRNLQAILASHSPDPYAEAIIKHSQKEFAEAIEIYKKILDQNPEDRQVPSKLAMCYREWLFYLTGKDAPTAEVQGVLQQALKCCPNSEILRDIQQIASGNAQ
jgi:tetratricopeptide (TPR) repeat protein